MCRTNGVGGADGAAADVFRLFLSHIPSSAEKQLPDNPADFSLQ